MDVTHMAAICEAVSEMDEPPRWPIYKTSGSGSRDDHVGSSYGTTAREALENFAARIGTDDYSLDTASANRLVLCPAHSRNFYYTYTS